MRERGKGAREFRGVDGAWDVLGEGDEGRWVSDCVCAGEKDVGGWMG